MDLPQRATALKPETVTNALASLSDSIAAVAALAEPWLVAVQAGPRAYVTGVAWDDGLIVTADQGLPTREEYSLVLPGGIAIAGRPVRREPALDLVLLRTDRPGMASRLVPAREPALGSLVVIVGSDGDGMSTVRLSTIRQQPRFEGRGAILDMTEARAEPGALVLDPIGAVLGILRADGDGTVSILPQATIARFVERVPADGAPTPPNPNRPVSVARTGHRRGWFGIALQPITVPEPLVARTGQTSGRLIVGITTGGPADEAGLRVGDVLLSLDGHGTNGTHSLRTILESTAIGTQIEARILRDNSVVTAWLTVAEQP